MRIFALVLLGLVSFAGAQSKKPRVSLETGFERNLGVTYKTVDKRELQLDVFYPAPNDAVAHPVVVYTHGGGWAAGSRFGASRGSFASLFKQLTKQGFCVVSVDYRLYSKTNSIRIRDCVTDCKDAVRYLVKNHEALKIDPKRLFSFGDSAGGHLAQMLLLSPASVLVGDDELADIDYNVVAGVSWYGPCDFEDSSLFNHDDRAGFKDRFSARIVGKDMDDAEKLTRYREVSPVTYLKKDSPPLLMIQGDKDTTIPVKHAYYIDKLAKPLGAPVEVLIVKNSGHNWRKVGQDIEPSREVIVDKTAQFFIQQLQQQ